ncbi:hypothetical protein [Eubacterium sp.]|uniref:rolling circle replication-associated protein n=1 Tax=Eubacterium sp. TaxID=142586 RepID=UPI0026DFBE3E|nr:hypothetical protein [Eubacterium sp.]MDO5434486.1 hypothetical protein [Eubacterium sp.]
MDTPESYNCRVYQYPAGMHVTFYKQAVNKGGENHKNFRKDYQNEERTEIEEKHCNSVSASATKNRIYNITRSNTWDWFITITFDREKVDSSNYEESVKKLTKFLNHARERKCPDLKYIIVPELHADGKHFHFHGLLSNCDGLHFSYSGHNTRGRNSKPIFNILDWSFGFTTATRIEDSSRASAYITKYITKECARHLKEKNKYFCSRNVERVQPDYFVQDEENFLQVYGDRITYVKSNEIKEAGQVITYYELKY